MRERVSKSSDANNAGEIKSDEKGVRKNCKLVSFSFRSTETQRFVVVVFELAPCTPL